MSITVNNGYHTMEMRIGTHTVYGHLNGDGEKATQPLEGVVNV